MKHNRVPTLANKCINEITAQSIVEEESVSILYGYDEDCLLQVLKAAEENDLQVTIHHGSVVSLKVARGLYQSLAKCLKDFE